MEVIRQVLCTCLCVCVCVCVCVRARAHMQSCSAWPERMEKGWDISRVPRASRAQASGSGPSKDRRGADWERGGGGREGGQPQHS